MKKVTLKPRENWQEIMMDIGFAFHSGDDGYWIEDSPVELTEKEAKDIERATNEVHSMCLELVSDIINKGDYQNYNLLSFQKEEIERGWNEKDFYLYGRYDLSLDKNGVPKFLEYNADTPTTLLEGALAQQRWQETIGHGGKYFNIIHEELQNRWKLWADKNPGKLLHFTTFENYEEDWSTLLYIESLARKVGINTKLVNIEDIQFDSILQEYLDKDDVPIKDMFKIYPWEWIWDNDFSLMMHNSIKIIEPAWKYLLSNKMMWPLLWKKYPNHPNLLASFLSYEEMEKVSKNYVSKPSLSREGNNVTMFNNLNVEVFSGGAYGDAPLIYQDRCDAKLLDGEYYNIGSWVIGDKAAGIGFRKEKDLIVRNISYYVPHYYK